MDFGGFWEASWGGKSSQEREKIDLKTHRKNYEKKLRFRSPGVGDSKGGSMAVGAQPPPLFSIFKEPSKPQPEHKAKTPKRTLRHAMRASAVADF